MTVQKKWKTTRSDGKYLFPRNAMRKVFKGKFIAELKKLEKQDLIDFPVDLKEKLYRKKWVVYAKRPFAKPQNVIEYLGRYTHKSAISNYRIEKVGNGVVTFKYKVYKKGGKVESMSLPVLEFVRRFALHILPHGFARMRHFGLLSSRGQITTLPVIQAEMNLNVQKSSKVQIRQKALIRLKSDNTCPCCGHKNLKNFLHFLLNPPTLKRVVL